MRTETIQILFKGGTRRAKKAARVIRAFENVSDVSRCRDHGRVYQAVVPADKVDGVIARVEHDKNVQGVRRVFETLRVTAPLDALSEQDARRLFAERMAGVKDICGVKAVPDREADSGYDEFTVDVLVRQGADLDQIKGRIIGSDERVSLDHRGLAPG